MSGDALDKHTLAWADALNKSREAYVTPAMLKGQCMVRVSIGGERTERADVEKSWTAMQRSG